MPGFVIDASATLPCCFAEEATPWTEGLLDRLQGGEEVRVPAHWPIEVMNGLIMAVRRKRIDLDRVARFAGVSDGAYVYDTDAVFAGARITRIRKKRMRMSGRRRA